MTTFTEKVEELVKEAFIQLQADPMLSTGAKALAVDVAQDIVKAHQAEISRRKEEWEKLRTQHEVGDIVGHYEITDRFKKVGKNTKYRVICKLCGAPMFRYSNRFKTNHKDCPAINKIKGEYNG